ncbi:molybdopterin adenylyltransferase [Campylobacter fetus]|nr:molybdopterin adenylyltransferase [Campylobacter fetus]
MKAKIGVLTLSDRASSGVYEDKSGIAIKDILQDWLISETEFIYKIIPDEYDLIVENLKDMCDVSKCDLIFTTGGTGPSPRDVTPEATEEICQKLMPGFGELMRTTSLKFVPTTILSRQTAGIRGKTLIVNLPGQPKAIRECLEPIFPAIPYCLDLIGAAYLQTDESKMKAFRPNKK